MTNTPSPDEDRELIERLRRKKFVRERWVEPVGTMDEPCDEDDIGAEAVQRNPDGPEAADRLESLLIDRAKLEEALLAGTLSMTNSQVIADFDTREDAELFYERLAIVLLNRSTDRAT